MSSSNLIVKATAGQVSCTINGEVVILSTKNGTYYGLDAVGAMVWSRVSSRPHSVQELCAEIVGQYAVEPGECEQDVLGLVQSLATAGLVEIQDVEGERVAG
jgi:hypothetical protein